MKTSELEFKPINNADNTFELFYELIKNEPQIDIPKKDDWLGECIYEIHHNNNLVGFVVYSRYDDDFCLSCIYIFKEKRNRGIATATLRKVMNTLKGKCNLLYGFVCKNNDIAINIYRKLGFRFLSNERLYNILNPSEDKCILQNDFYEFGVKL